MNLTSGTPNVFVMYPIGYSPGNRSPYEVIKTVEQLTGVKIETVAQKTRKYAILEKRYVFVVALRHLTKLKLDAIAKLVGYSDHSMCSHSYYNTQNLVETGHPITEQLAAIVPDLVKQWQAGAKKVRKIPA